MSEPQGIHRRIQFTVTNDLVTRFNAKVQKGEPDACWPWIGAPRNGYGAIKHSGKVLGTHVVAFVIANGPAPEGQLVMHSCDNRICCNPSHLSAGTFGDNVREMFDRRSVNVGRGEGCPHATLTEELVRLIHALRIVRRIGARRIHRIIGINEHTAKNVIEGASWRHVKLPTQEEAEQIIAHHEAEHGGPASLPAKVTA